LARLLPTLLVVALLAATAAAFAVAQHLKSEKSPILRTEVDKILSPTCGCKRDVAKIRFRLRKPDRLTVTIVAGETREVRTLVSSRPVRVGLEKLAWDGRDDTGAAVGDGRYRPRVHLARAHRTILLPNPITIDTEAPTISLASVRPRIFSPDGDFKLDYLSVHYRADEPARALLYVNGKLRERVKYFRTSGVLQWPRGRPRGTLPPGPYRIALRAEDHAGNRAALTAPQTVRVRYLELPRHVYRVRANSTFVVRASTDARRVRWRIGSRAGRGNGRFLVLRAGDPGRYRLVVSERGHSDRALLIVRP
jgi:hypothetical protein